MVKVVKIILEVLGSSGIWIPKQEDDKRFFGKPNTINRTYYEGKKGGYYRETKIGSDGKAAIERHYTDHNLPKFHSDPHDHKIEWNETTGAPIVGHPINYPNGVPEFKSFKGVVNMNANMPNDNYFEENRFKTIEDFKWSINHGAEIEIEWNDKSYFINQPNGIITIHEEDKWLDAKEYKNVDEALEHMIEGQKLRDIITQVKVWNRTI